MSVFIHNIGIPKTGYVDVRLFSDGRATTQTGDRPFYREMKIEEVPEKHGRLIDADAMIHYIEKAIITSWYIKERNADMVKFLSLEDAIIPASEEE